MAMSWLDFKIDTAIIFVMMANILLPAFYKLPKKVPKKQGINTSIFVAMKAIFLKWVLLKWVL